MSTIIYPPSIPWNWMFQRPQQILRQLSVLGYTVLYEDLGHHDSPKIQALSSNFHLCQGVSALSVPHRRPRILWITVPSHINLIEQYAPDLVVCDAVDEPKDEFAGWAPYYPQIIKKADLIFASARSIYESLSAQHPNVHLVPNGVDFSHFASGKLSRPSDLPKGKTIIGYSGAMAPWVDWDLLRYMIGQNPDLHFAFMGTLFMLDKFPLKYRNATYLGLKHYSKLPAYLHNFKVGLIPFKLTDMTKGCNPIKLYEYYAAGLPVLGTPLPELLAIPKIHLEKDPVRFSARLRQLALQGDPWNNERLAYAQGNDWLQRAHLINVKIQETLLTKPI